MYLDSLGKGHILTYISAAIPTVSKAVIVKVLWEKFLHQEKSMFMHVHVLLT